MINAAKEEPLSTLRVYGHKYDEGALLMDINQAAFASHLTTFYSLGLLIYFYL